MKRNFLLNLIFLVFFIISLILSLMIDFFFFIPIICLLPFSFRTSTRDKQDFKEESSDFSSYQTFFSQEIRYCPNCGGEISKSIAQFCYHCGEKLNKI